LPTTVPVKGSAGVLVGLGVGGLGGGEVGRGGDVGAAVGVSVGGSVAVLVGVSVGRGVSVAGGVLVRVGVDVGVCVGVGVGEGVDVSVGVAVAVKVGMGVRVAAAISSASWRGPISAIETARTIQIRTMAATIMRRVFMSSSACVYRTGDRSSFGP
jgi:hypothetical protein